MADKPTHGGSAEFPGELPYERKLREEGEQINQRTKPFPVKFFVESTPTTDGKSFINEKHEEQDNAK